MEKDALIAMLNNDLADEHAAIIRYLVHGWMEGEDTPLGSSLISISREEMWHMHWLGMIIGRLGGEIVLTPNPYPHDPSSRETLLHSYIAYEEKLIPHYKEEAEKVDDPQIRRVLQREGWESAVHAKKFARKLKKLKGEEKKGLPQGDGELPKSLIDTLQNEVVDKYTEMLRHMSASWRFQSQGTIGWEMMDQAMAKMKQLAHFAEDVAEDGGTPKFESGKIDPAQDLKSAIEKAISDVHTARMRHLKLKDDGEFRKHEGLMINLDLTVQQEEYHEEELRSFKDRV